MEGSPLLDMLWWGRCLQVVALTHHEVECLKLGNANKASGALLQANFFSSSVNATPKSFDLILHEPIIE